MDKFLIYASSMIYLFIYIEDFRFEIMSTRLMPYKPYC